jgi:hypothetical protein
MWTLNQTQAFLAPIATPAAPAIVLASQLYAGSVQTGTPQWLALIGAGASGMGMEMAGALAFTMILTTFKRKAWLPMSLGILAVVCYAAFAIVGISQAPKGSAFATFVLMSLVAFLASALYSYTQEMRIDEAANLKLLQAETAKIQAEKNRANAEARRARAGNLPTETESYRKVTDFRKLSDSDRARVATMTTADIVREFGVTDRTARNWRNG